MALNFFQTLTFYTGSILSFQLETTYVVDCRSSQPEQVKLPLPMVVRNRAKVPPANPDHVGKGIAVVNLYVTPVGFCTPWAPTTVL